MKLKDLRNKELGELKKLTQDARKDVVKLQLEHPLRKDKNVKKLWAKRREIAVLSGLLSAKEIGASK